jgi:hypothetical protein
MIIFSLFCQFTLALEANIERVETDDIQTSFISVSGVIEATMAKKLKHQLDTNLALKLRTAILINSIGGILQKSFDVSKVIMDFSKDFYAKTHKTTIVLFHGECSSGCTFLMAQLNHFADPQVLEVVIADTTKIYLHGPRQSTGKQFSATQKKDYADNLANIYAEYIKDGVNPEWLEAKKDIFNNRQNEAEFSAKEICASNANLIRATGCISNEDAMVKIEAVLATNHRLQN